MEGQKKGHFVGRSEEVSLLANDLVRKDSGSILVSGTRGVGKTSLVYAALNKVEGMKVSDGRTLLPVILNASQLQQHLTETDPVQTRVIQSLIRRLYAAVYQRRRSAISDDEFLKTELKEDLENLYRKAVAQEVKIEAQRETTASEGDAAVDEQTTTVSATPNLRLLIGSMVAFVAGVLAAVGVADSSLPALVGSVFIAVLGVVGVSLSYVKTTTKKTQTSSGKDTKASEYYLMDNDIGNLEADLEDVLVVLRRRYRVVFVVDELDKLVAEKDGAEKTLSLIRGFKNLFTLSPAVFVFITSQEVYEKIETDRQSREVDGTLFTHRFFIKRPEHGDLEVFVREVGRLQNPKQDELYSKFIDYACFVSRSDFTFLYEVLRDHVTGFDGSHQPIISIRDLSADEGNKANAQKAIELIYDRYRYARPSGWQKNEILMAQMYDAIEQFIDEHPKASIAEPVSDDIEASAVMDLLALLERHGGLKDEGLLGVETGNGETEEVTKYSWTGRISPVGDDALDEPTTLEKSVLSAEQRLDNLVNEFFRASYGVKSNKTLQGGVLYKNRYSTLTTLTELDLAVANAEVKPILAALKQRPIGHKTREQKDDAAITLGASYEEVAKVAHKAVASIVTVDGLVTTNLNQTPQSVDAGIRDAILDSGVPNVVLWKQGEPSKAAIFLLEAEEALLDDIARRLNTRNATLRVVDVRCSSGALKVGDKANRRGVMSVSFMNTGALIIRARTLRNWWLA
jgi:hypothetical protein